LRLSGDHHGTGDGVRRKRWRRKPDRRRAEARPRIDLAEGPRIDLARRPAIDLEAQPAADTAEAATDAECLDVE